MDPMEWNGTKDYSDWVAITFDTGNRGLAGAVAQFCILGGKVEFRGKAEKTTGSWPTGTTTLVSTTPIPSEYWPKDFRRDFQVAGSSGERSVKLNFNTDGSIQLIAGLAGEIPAYVSFDNVSYIP